MANGQRLGHRPNGGQGTKFSGQNSQVKLTPLVTVQNNLQIPAASLSAATTDEEIDAYLSGDDVSNIALFDHLYPEYNLEWREDKLRELFDWVPVDVESVKAYVYWLETESEHVYKYLLLFETLGMNAVVKQFLNDSCENTQVIFLDAWRFGI